MYTLCKGERPTINSPSSTSQGLLASNTRDGLEAMRRWHTVECAEHLPILTVESIMLAGYLSGPLAYKQCP
jgi:hypothetical protein